MGNSGGLDGVTVRATLGVDGLKASSVFGSNGMCVRCDE